MCTDLELGEVPEELEVVGVDPLRVQVALGRLAIVPVMPPSEDD